MKQDPKFLNVRQIPSPVQMINNNDVDNQTSRFLESMGLFDDDNRAPNTRAYQRGLFQIYTLLVEYLYDW